MLSYLKGNRLWQLHLKAARLVPEFGESRLPSPIGDIVLQEIRNPADLGIPDHPLKTRYPNLDVQQYAMIIEKRFMVERHGIEGVALYVDNNNSGLSLSITSENGRNPLAPWDWEGEPGSLTDPSTQTFVEWRRIKVGDQFYPWSNAAIHGWRGMENEYRGLDWRDGVPETLETMYDKHRGRVVQSIMVPHEARGLGVAEQTMAQEDVKDTYSVLVFFPRPEFREMMERLNHRDVDDNWRGGIPKSFSTFEATRSYSLNMDESVLESATIEADFKMAAGGAIQQGIIPNPFSPMFWETEPSALFVCWPVSEENAHNLLRSPGYPRRKGF